jgi:hypothetical protein
MRSKQKIRALFGILLIVGCVRLMIGIAQILAIEYERLEYTLLHNSENTSFQFYSATLVAGHTYSFFYAIAPEFLCPVDLYLGSILIYTDFSPIFNASIYSGEMEEAHSSESV